MRGWTGLPWDAVQVLGTVSAGVKADRILFDADQNLVLLILQQFDPDSNNLQ
jgi:hypothetical protein